MQDSNWSIAGRPTLLFVAAYMVTMTSHEATHAAVAYLLGFSSTLYQLWVNLDATNATRVERTLIAVAGPAFNLCVGGACWLIYRSYRQAPTGLLWLMLAISGIYAFLGNLFGAAFGGDVSQILRLWGVPPGIRWTVTAVGLVLLSAFMFCMGKELLLWSPHGLRRTARVVCATAAPWIIGGTLALLLYLPLPAYLVGPTLVGSIFWVFAVVGATLGRNESQPVQSGISSIRVSDLIIASATLVVVRLLVGGIRLVPQ